MSDYTREQILSMQGRELDLIVEKNIFGHELTYEDDPNGVWDSDGVDEQQKPINLRFVKVKPYSTDLYAAWEVVEKMSEQWPQYQLAKIEDGWSVMWGFDGYGWPEATGKTAPEAICKAALLAVIEK